MTTKIESLEDGIYTDTATERFSEAQSEDRTFSWSSFSPGCVGISCEATGLPDNTMGNAGRHVVHLASLNLSAYPNGADLSRRAREFYTAVETLRTKRHEAQEDRDLDALEAEIEGAVPVSSELAALLKTYPSADAAWEAEDEQAWAKLRKAGY